MSELSEGQGANGKEATQAGSGNNWTGKRRRKKRHRHPRGSKRPEGHTAAGEVEQRPQEQSAQPEASAESDSGNRANNRVRRQTSRPGKKRQQEVSEKRHLPSSHSETSSPLEPSTNKQADEKSQSRRGRDQRHDNQRRKSPVYAALDLGTNNCRLLMAVPRQRGKFRVIDGFSRIVRLGEGLSQTGRLSENAMDRAVEALKHCAEKLENRPVKRSRLIATEACRQAENGEEFLERVFHETGMKLEIVTRETEARLAAEGCGSLMDRESHAAVMFDIGGGSTELILVNGRRVKKGRIRDRIGAWTSLPMGVVTLAERFGGKEVSLELFEEMKGAVVEEIERFEGGKSFQADIENPNVHLLGTSGTVTTLAGIHLGLRRYERRRVDGLWMTSDDIDSVTSMLLDMDYEQRRQNPCIGSERADLVLAGCAILEAIREVWPADRLRVADRGLREGLLTEMMNADRVWKSGWPKRRHARRGEATA